ncbi:MAG TPA: Uma2 family endonuclease [Dehalococcoidia bacterium]|nr:Uma2 family endonuclease [Dehalococcoidia bacterium]
MAILLTTHRFTVADYHRMVEARILDEDDRVELIEGEIVDMSPIGRKHAVCVARLTDVFGERLRRRAVVWPQNPIRLDEHTEPQPDLALLRWRSDYYAERDPTPADVLLLIEVCDTSLAVDRDLKALLYARAGIPEVWVLDLNGRDVIVFRDPAPAGYRSIDTYRGGDRLSPGSFPDLSFTADQILG